MFSKRGWESIGSACTFDFESEFKQNSQLKPLKWSKCVGGGGKMLLSMYMVMPSYDTSFSSCHKTAHHIQINSSIYIEIVIHSE